MLIRAGTGQAGGKQAGTPLVAGRQGLCRSLGNIVDFVACRKGVGLTGTRLQ